MRARVGKIARLPEPIREALNQRLLNGISGKKLAVWLNALPEVTKVVTELFAGRSITEHNISEWRQGGHQDWLRQMETRERVLRITDQYKDSDSEVRMARRLQSLMTAELTDAADQLHQMKDGNARWERLRKISKELCRLQMARCRGLEVQLQHEKARRAGSYPIGASRTISNQKGPGGGIPATEARGPTSQLPIPPINRKFLFGS